MHLHASVSRSPLSLAFFFGLISLIFLHLPLTLSRYPPPFPSPAVDSVPRHVSSVIRRLRARIGVVSSDNFPSSNHQPSSPARLHRQSPASRVRLAPGRCLTPPTPPAALVLTISRLPAAGRPGVFALV
ncbi:hypothetical protein CDD83_6898 [Cordyceps sp. RAO-2017]|nr:hypothetical protein CDD83_6898 [Cordyceps sp. RAO-2017]